MSQEQEADEGVVRTRSTRVAKNIFNILGPSASEASALKIKADILSAILEHEGLHAGSAYGHFGRVPSVSEQPAQGTNLPSEIEKLLHDDDRLHLQTSIAMWPRPACK
jgi:hypothetical protein